MHSVYVILRVLLLRFRTPSEITFQKQYNNVNCKLYTIIVDILQFLFSCLNKPHILFAEFKFIASFVKLSIT